jgi:hypothetical protein
LGGQQDPEDCSGGWSDEDLYVILVEDDSRVRGPTLSPGNAVAVGENEIARHSLEQMTGGVLEPAGDYR